MVELYVFTWAWKNNAPFVSFTFKLLLVLRLHLLQFFPFYRMWMNEMVQQSCLFLSILLLPIWWSPIRHFIITYIHHTQCKRKRCCIKIRRLPYLLFSMTDELANMYRIHAGVLFTNISGTLCMVKIWLFTFIPKYYLSCCANPLTSFNQYAHATWL